MAASAPCIHCGAPLSPDQNYCIKCGARCATKETRLASAIRTSRLSKIASFVLVLFAIAGLTWWYRTTWPSSLPMNSLPVEQQPESAMHGPSKSPPTALEVPMGTYTGER
ncbi:MAG: zinc ribbon domain-containing protein [Planctomycetes bacterium]|nr:zinc ribbon domain-containing protein [Planctomycetota bacterium]